MNDDTLERLLSTSAAAIGYPATPDLTSRVIARLGTPVHQAAPRWRFSPAYVLAAALLLLVVALALNPSRDAIARFFGVEGSKIEVLPTTAPGVTATPFPAPDAGSPGRVIDPIAPGELPLQAGFAAALPDIRDPRLRSVLVFYGDLPVVVHYYEAFDLWQTRLPQDAAFGKLVEPDSIREEVMVNGENGIWLTGGEHFVRYLRPDGREVAGSARIVSRSTLIWRTDAFFYRIETGLSLEEALRIAETLP